MRRHFENDQEAYRELQYARQLIAYEPFKTWVGMMDEQIKLLRDAGLLVTSKPDTPQEKMLKLIGMEPPQNQEERLRVFLAFTAVVTFWSRIFADLAREAKDHEAIERKLQGTKDGDIGINRPVAG